MTFTRTITIYNYTCGRFDPSTLSISDMTVHSFPAELGKRAQSALAKQYGPVLNVATRDVLIEIEAEDFIRNGSIIEVNGEKVQNDDDRRKLANELNIHCKDNALDWNN